MTHGELRVLCDRNGWEGARRLALDKALHEFVTVDIAGSEIVEAYRRIEEANAAIQMGHQNMGKNDVWIAATAMVRDYRCLQQIRTSIISTGIC